MREKGLYKQISETELLYAETAIYYPDGTIIKVSDYENSDNIIDDWKWFNSRDEAISYYEIIENREML
jgi:hypothetical protein